MPPPNAERPPQAGRSFQGHQGTDNQRHRTAHHRHDEVALDVARELVNQYHRGTLSERVAWLHSMVIGATPWWRIADEAERILHEAREAAYIVEGVESPAVPAMTTEAARATLTERAKRSSLTGRFVAQREDVLGRRAA
jgi:hypothetical protein